MKAIRKDVLEAMAKTRPVEHATWMQWIDRGEARVIDDPEPGK